MPASQRVALDGPAQVLQLDEPVLSERQVHISRRQYRLSGGSGKDLIFARDGNVEEVFGDAGSDRAAADEEGDVESVEELIAEA